MIPQGHPADSAAVEERHLADVALRSAAGLWFLVVLIGQWLFAYYIVALYGALTVSGHFEGWTKKATLVKGYVEGDTLGNLTFAAHILLAVVVVFGGVLQLIPQIRERAIAVHRWNGRVFLVAAAAVGVDGLYMIWVRQASWNPVNSVSVSLNAVLILVFAAVAWRAARARDIDSHRRWALRTFLVVNGPAAFIRIGVAAWSVLASGAGLDGSDGPGPMMYFFMFASYLVPLGVLELYLRARTSATIVRFATAIVLLAFTAYMSVGTYAAAMSRRVILGELREESWPGRTPPVRSSGRPPMEPIDSPAGGARPPRGMGPGQQIGLREALAGQFRRDLVIQTGEFVDALASRMLDEAHGVRARTAGRAPDPRGYRGGHHERERVARDRRGRRSRAHLPPLHLAAQTLR